MYGVFGLHTYSTATIMCNKSQIQTRRGSRRVLATDRTTIMKKGDGKRDWAGWGRRVAAGVVLSAPTRTRGG